MTLDVVAANIDLLVFGQRHAVVLAQCDLLEGDLLLGRGIALEDGILNGGVDNQLHFCGFQNIF